MKSKSLTLDRIRIVMVYDISKSPVSISLTSTDDVLQPFGTLAYAVPGADQNAFTTILNFHEPTTETATRIAQAIAIRANRPTFVNANLIADIQFYGQLVDTVLPLLSGEA